MDSFIDFTDLNEIREFTRPKQDTPTNTPIKSTTPLNSPVIKAVEAKILLTIKSRENKVNLLNAYLTRLGGIIC